MKRILIVDDEPRMLEALRRMLRFMCEDWDVEVTENGRSALERAGESPQPDLILCDVMMPGIDGYEVLESLRSNPVTSWIPFIFLTGRGDRNDVRKGMQLGADDYLTKPVDREDLIASIRTRLERHAALGVQTTQSMEELRESIALSIPHELRTPLTGILGASRLIMKSADTAERHTISDMATIIHESAERLHRLIENFLAFAQIELLTRSPEEARRFTDCRCAHPEVVITSAAKVASVQYERVSDLEMEVEDAVVNIFEEHLSRTVLAIVENAFKFSEPGSPVRVAGLVRGDSFVFEVTDQGRGMSADEIERVGALQQFRRLLHEQQGAGLGLAIVRRLAELYRGSLEIESELGVGTTVRLTFASS